MAFVMFPGAVICCAAEPVILNVVLGDAPEAMIVPFSMRSPIKFIVIILPELAEISKLAVLLTVQFPFILKMIPAAGGL